MVWNPIHDDLFSSINQLITNNISEMFCYFALKNEGIYEGLPKQVPQRVYGGLLHTMWRLDTDQDAYAIKQLSKDIDLTNDHIIKNYELSERIASRFSALGIPAIPAIEAVENLIEKYLNLILLFLTA
jgi:hypothetical protein